jgi:hypothetical protein
MGEPLIYNRLLGQIMSTDGVLDASLLVGAEYKGQFVSFRSNVSTDGRKAKIDTQHIFVGLMDELVRVSVSVKVEPKAGTAPKTEAVQAALRQDGPAYSAVKSAIDATLSSAASQLTRTALEAGVRPVLDAQSPPLQLASSLTLGAEYVESGRLLKNTDQLAVAENEVLQLGDLSLAMKSGLDV